MPATLDLSTEFADRRVLVTGASRGIGAAIAERIAAGGGRVVAAARTVPEELAKGAAFVTGDVSTAVGAATLVEAAVAVLGGLDVLVNNAGAARAHLTGIGAIPDDEWQDALDVNFLSAVRVTAAALPALRASPAAAVVNITSGQVRPLPGPLAHYGAAKAALQEYSLALATELAAERIRVNLVTPGPVASPGGAEIRRVLTSAAGITEEQFLSAVPLGRVGQPQEVAEVVAFLASARGAWITGQNSFVDGGIGTL